MVKHGRWRSRAAPRVGLVLLAASATWSSPLGAQESAPVSVRAGWDEARWLSSQDRLTFEFSRPLNNVADRVGLVIGGTDFSDMLVTRGAQSALSTDLVRLPVGEQEATVYLVRNEVEWTEVARFSLRVRSRAGLEQTSIRPSIELNSVGQLARRDPPDVPLRDRRTYQDLTLRLGVEGTASRDGWNMSLQGNAIGVSQDAQRLRFAELQDGAPMLDLAEYQMQANRPGLTITLGHQATGRHRFLPNGFGSRGLGARATIGPAVEVEAALLNGTNIAGWNNPFGVADPTHRIASAGLAMELIPSRPGAISLQVSAVDGSVLPLTGFNQGSPADAEVSRGGGFHLVTSDIDQRLLFQMGYARSRFTNPSDPLLSGGADIVAVESDTRSAQYAELSIEALRDISVFGLATAATVTGRHERVDPLYRSVGTFVTSDRDANGVDAVGSFGVLGWHVGASTSRDNLQRLASVLTTRTNDASVGAAIPLGALRSTPTVWLPAISYAMQRTHQYGDDVPINGEFDPSHIPDQVSRNETVSANWNANALTVGYRWNASHQDNRQPGRENSDFLTVVNAVSVGAAPRRGIDVSLDVSRERQTLYEQSITQQLDRVGASMRWQPFSRTDVLGVVSQSWGTQPSVEQRTRNTEYQLELSRGFDVYRRYDGGSQGRLFIRYARTRAALLPFVAQPLLDARITWTLNAGGSLRLF